MTKKLLMGNEAFAHAALEAGVNVVAGYPGTPSSEVIETVARLHAAGKAEGVYVEWSTNEKAALEFAAAASMSGARALFTCKQVGLNVASDALMSLNYVGVRGGLVVFVADDPGPISSQTEQDTRRFAAFAKIPVFDPATPEQAFEMMKTAFDLSEAYRTPVIVRPTTRIDHASTFFEVADETQARPLPEGGFSRDPSEWVIFPKRSYRGHQEINKRLQDISRDYTYDPVYARFNPVFERNVASRPLIAEVQSQDEERTGSRAFSAAEVTSTHHFSQGSAPTLGILTGGVSTQYALEALDLIQQQADRAGIEVPSYRFMQIGTPYPFPRRSVSRFLKDLMDVLVLEELDSVIEEDLLKVAGNSFLSPTVHGKLTGEASEAGENSTEDAAFRIAFFFDKYKKVRPDVSGNKAQGITLEQLVEHAIGPNALFSYSAKLPVRPPVLCAGCPHRGSFYAMKRAIHKLKISREDAVFTGDIGCYTLGNADPLDAVDTCLCMGAGITMAQGFAAADPAKKNIAFIGDSTFFASGMTGVANAVYNQHDITICVLDNSTTAMTGSQPHPGTGVTLMGPKSEPIDIESVLRALGVSSVWTVDPLDEEASENVCIDALEETGPNAIIFKSPCVWLKPFGTPAKVHVNRCTGCKKCISEIGCPAIGFDPETRGARSARRGQAVIDESQCNGCGLCLQVCPFSAIEIITPEEKELFESATRATRKTSGTIAERRADRRESVGTTSVAGSVSATGTADAADAVAGRDHADIGDDKTDPEEIAEPIDSDIRLDADDEEFEFYEDLVQSRVDDAPVLELEDAFEAPISRSKEAGEGLTDALDVNDIAVRDAETAADELFRYMMKERDYSDIRFAGANSGAGAASDADGAATATSAEDAEDSQPINTDAGSVPLSSQSEQLSDDAEEADPESTDASENAAVDIAEEDDSESFEVLAALNAGVFLEIDDEEDVPEEPADGEPVGTGYRRRVNGGRESGSGDDKSDASGGTISRGPFSRNGEDTGDREDDASEQTRAMDDLYSKYYNSQFGHRSNVSGGTRSAGSCLGNSAVDQGDQDKQDERRDSDQDAAGHANPTSSGTNSANADNDIPAYRRSRWGGRG